MPRLPRQTRQEPMKISASEIASRINGRLKGVHNSLVTGVSSFEDAVASDLTFACDPKFLSRLDETKAGVVLVPDSFIPKPSLPEKICLIFSNDPKIAFFKMVEQFYPPETTREEVHPSAVIGEGVILGKGSQIDANVVVGDKVNIGENVHVMANCYIGRESVIGGHTLVKPNVTLMEKTRIGCHGLVHSGTVIGSDGFGFARQGEGHTKLIHTGHVEIGDHAEIGACNTIDRGTLGVTRLGHGVKTDNLVHIAHNVKIGDNCLVVAQVGIAGSTSLGENVIIAGKAGVSGHLNIGDNAIVGPYAGVTADVAPNEIVSGIPHMPHKTWLKVANIISRLPEMRKKILSFERKMKKLEIEETE